MLSMNEAAPSRAPAFPPVEDGWIESEILQDIYRHWLGLAHGPGLPVRDDFDPVDVPLLLPYVYLVDVIDGGADFRYRVVGTHITESAGFDFTGQLVSDFMRTNESEDRAGEYHRCLGTGQPNCRSGNLVDYGREHMLYERLLCPMTRTSGKVELILGGLHFRIVGESETEAVA